MPRSIRDRDSIVIGHRSFSEDAETSLAERPPESPRTASRSGTPRTSGRDPPGARRQGEGDSGARYAARPLGPPLDGAGDHHHRIALGRVLDVEDEQLGRGDPPHDQGEGMAVAVEDQDLSAPGADGP